MTRLFHPARPLLAAALAALVLGGCAAQSNTSMLVQQQRLLARRLADTRADLEGLRLEVSRLRGRLDRVDGGAYGREGMPGDGAAPERAGMPADTWGSTGPGTATGYGQPPEGDRAAWSAGAPVGQPAPGAYGAQLPPAPGQPVAAPGLVPPPAAPPPAAPAGFADLNQDLARGAGDAAFVAGLEALRRGDREGAIQTLRDYAAKNRDGALAPYAQFWVGEAQLASGRYYEAILAYNDVATNWPKSERVPAAKLRQAEAFAASGDPMDARLYLKELIDKYPGTSEAAEAERRLRSLGG